MPSIISHLYRTLPNIKNMLKQRWQLLKIDPTLENTSQHTPILAFGINRNLKDIIGSYKIEVNKVLHETKQKSLNYLKKTASHAYQTTEHSATDVSK